jgi:uncharacterized protein
VAGSILESRGECLGRRRLNRAPLAALLAAFASLWLLPPALADGGGDGLVWVVRGEHNTVYIAGSVHLLRPDGAPLPAPLERAYREAESLLMEIDLDDLDPTAGARFTAAHAVYGADRSLRDALGESRWKKTADLAQQLGLPLAVIERFEPWAVALLLSVAQLQQAGMSIEAGVEQQLLRRAGADAKPINGLETLEQQLQLFDGLDEAAQIRFLEMAVDDAASVSAQLDSIDAAWRAGREQDLAQLLRDEYARFPELFQLLVDRRNAAWIEPLRALLTRRDDVLVVVGALHLVGEGSVIDLLRRAGLEPERLRAN